MILVTVGTHHQPFDRLVEASARLAGTEHVVVQRGTSGFMPQGCEVVDHVAPEVLDAWIRAARVVVTHAGPATVTAVWATGGVPVVVPRRAALGEHVDDHQVAWAASVSDCVVVVQDVFDLPGIVRAPPRRRVPEVRDPDDFAAAFGALVDRVVSARRAARRS